MPGDSPADQHKVLITGSDGAGTHAKTVSGTAVTAKFAVDYIPDWTVPARAHNATGRARGRPASRRGCLVP